MSHNKLTVHQIISVFFQDLEVVILLHEKGQSHECDLLRDCVIFIRDKSENNTDNYCI